MTVAEKDAAFAIVVPANPLLEDAAKLARDLKTVPATTVLEIDAGAVEGMSTAYALTIVSAIQSRADLTPPARVSNADAAFVDAFSDLGLFQEMMKMEFVA